MSRRLSTGVAAASITICWSVAFAQQNEAYVEQNGTANILFIDQSEAIASTVRGLSLARETNLIRSVADEDGNLITLSPSQVSSVLVLAPEESASQTGSGNVASVVVSGSGGTVLLDQDNGSLSGTIGNTADIRLSGNGIAAVGQLGSSNVARLMVRNGGLTGTILQDGLGNEATLTVGDGNEGLISQIGDGNDTTVDVGGVNTSITYILEGNNLQSINPHQGLEIISNAAAITIIQRSLVP